MQFGFFDVDDKYQKLTKLGDPLAKIDKHVDFSIFAEEIRQFLSNRPKGATANPKKAGRKPLCPLKIFKVLFVKRLFNLSCEQTEYQITDRHSFQRFIGIDPNKNAPDFTTVWRYEELLSEDEVLERIFARFNTYLEEHGLFAQEGSIVDATIVEAPRQRNHRDENKQIKKGEIPQSFQNNPRKLAQKDTDARWTKKNNQTYYGYKNHIMIDNKYKLIRDYVVTPASVHDSQPAPMLAKNAQEGERFWGDSAYTTEILHKLLEEKGIVSEIHEKGYKNKPLTQAQIESNHIKSKTRCRVEHIFAFITNSMNGKKIRAIGLKRAKVQIGLTNLTYNICRFIQLTKQELQTTG